MVFLLVILVADAVLVCTITHFKVIGAPDICSSLVVSGHGGYVDAGCLAVTFHRTAELPFTLQLHVGFTDCAVLLWLKSLLLCA